MSIPSSVIYYVGYDQLKDVFAPQMDQWKVGVYTPVVAGSLSRGKSLVQKILKQQWWLLQWSLRSNSYVHECKRQVDLGYTRLLVV